MDTKTMFTDLLPILYVDDIERSVGLYRDIFGMTETYRFPRDGAAEHVELKLGKAVLGISSAAGLISQGMPPATRGTPFELAFGTDDTDTSFRLLTAAGCRPLREPFDTTAGNRSAYVEDYDGNRLSIYARRPV
jgi:catechol 2,3-dioxygenase-like lactoylglutathione lyase family enzyme